MLSTDELNRSNHPELFNTANEIETLGNAAVRKAQKENVTEGIPNVFSVDGKIFYEVNGTVTTQSPFDAIKTTPESKIQIGNERFAELISDKDISDSIARDSLDISMRIKKYENHEDILFVVMMNSGAWYSSRLFNRLQANAYKITYASTHCSKDKIKVSTKAKKKDIEGKHIIIISGLSSDGKSVTKLSSWMESMGAKTVDSCIMIKRLKCSVNTINTPIIINDDDFVVGGGIGYNDYGRNFNIIYKRI